MVLVLPSQEALDRLKQDETDFVPVDDGPDSVRPDFVNKPLENCCVAGSIDRGRTDFAPDDTAPDSVRCLQIVCSSGGTCRGA